MQVDDSRLLAHVAPATAQTLARRHHARVVAAHVNIVGQVIAVRCLAATVEDALHLRANGMRLAGRASLAVSETLLEIRLKIR